MAIPFLGEIERLINEHGSATILRERLQLANDRYVELEKQVAKLQEEKRELQEQVAELSAALRATQVSKEFEEEHGALFKRRAGGGYHRAVYCPECKRAASEFAGEFDCSCGWHTDLGGKTLEQVIANLPA